MSQESDIHFYNLIGKKLSGQITVIENESLQEILRSSEDAREVFENLKVHWSRIQFSNESINDSVHRKIADMIWDKSFG